MFTLTLTRAEHEKSRFCDDLEGKLRRGIVVFDVAKIVWNLWRDLYSDANREQRAELLPLMDKIQTLFSLGRSS